MLLQSSRPRSPILAPMVRIGTLPMRLLALEYGASEVYSPEIVDKSILSCKRTFNSLTGTWDYVLQKDPSKIIFRTHPKERSKLIFQIGSSDPSLAVAAASLVREDVSEVNLNCGCPKKFSLQGGMGAALLKEPERLLGILRALIGAGLQKPISCKIRILSCLNATLELCERIINTGIETLIIHCRTAAQTPKDPANWEALRFLGERLQGKVRLIANGDFVNVEQFMSSNLSQFYDNFMVARAAMKNPSLFQGLPHLLPLEQVSKRYLELSCEGQNSLANSKFVLLCMWEPSSPKGKQILASKTWEELYLVFGMMNCRGGDHGQFERRGGGGECDEFPYVPDHSRY